MLGRYNNSHDELDKALQVYKQTNNPGAIAFLNIIRSWIYLESYDIVNSQKSIDRWHTRLASIPKAKIHLVIFCNIYRGLVAIRLGNVDSAKSHLKMAESLITKTIPIWKEMLRHFCLELYCELLVAQDSLEKSVNISETISGAPLPRVFGYSHVMTIYNVPFSKDLSARIYQRNRNLNKAIAEYENIMDINRDKKDLWDIL